MTDADLNQNIKLAPHDWLMAKTVLRLFPQAVWPNHITAARFFTSPIVFCLLWQGFYKVGLVAFLLVAFTDAIDGSMARTRKRITIWGTKYDGVADKFLIVGVVMILVLQCLGWLLAGTIIGVEFSTIIVAAFYARKGIVSQANIWGKTKMVVQVAATSLLIIYIISGVAMFLLVGQWLFVLAILLSFVSVAVHSKNIHV